VARRLEAVKEAGAPKGQDKPILYTHTERSIGDAGDGEGQQNARQFTCRQVLAKASEDVDAFTNVQAHSAGSREGEDAINTRKVIVGIFGR
jgi:hypothetical protein